jgi:hypothetical protein
MSDFQDFHAREVLYRIRRCVTIECKTKIGDCTYELFVGTCSCGQPIYRLMRTCGASLSVYQISQKDYENLEEYIAELHATFAVDVHSRIDRLRQTIEELNSKGLFEAEEIDVSHVRRIDKARLILSRLSKNGRLKQILNNADDVEDDFAAAFLLGCLATDNSGSKPMKKRFSKVMRTSKDANPAGLWQSRRDYAKGSAVAAR